MIFYFFLLFFYFTFCWCSTGTQRTGADAQTNELLAARTNRRTALHLESCQNQNYVWRLGQKTKRYHMYVRIYALDWWLFQFCSQQVHPMSCPPIQWITDGGSMLMTCKCHCQDLTTRYWTSGWKGISTCSYKSGMMKKLMDVYFNSVFFFLLRNLGVLTITARHHRSLWQRALQIETGSFFQFQPTNYRFPLSIAIPIQSR